MATWIAISKDTQGDGASGACGGDLIPIETDPEKIPPLEDIEIVVLNGTDRDGLAETARNQLEERGFTVVESDDTEARVDKSAEVTYGPDQYLAGLHVKSYFYRGAENFQADWDKPVTVTVGEGFDQVLRTDEALRTWSHASSIDPPKGTCSVD
ncbi:LytR C-terminal domain-containing protein [Salininema proteolyticum]|uniref:LytR C-terminal domain-containing protein n=1 Tax=Salininema proteolyticum TaxID=1607685 RepID=UPI00363C2C40